MNGGEPIGTPIPILGASLGLSGCQNSSQPRTEVLLGLPYTVAKALPAL